MSWWQMALSWLHCFVVSTMLTSKLSRSHQSNTVPAYSPHAVAEYAVALMLSLNHGNLSCCEPYEVKLLHGLLGFDVHGNGWSSVWGRIAGADQNSSRLRMIWWRPTVPRWGVCKQYGVKIIRWMNSMPTVISSHYTVRWRQICSSWSTKHRQDEKKGRDDYQYWRGQLIHTEDLIEDCAQTGWISWSDVYEEEKNTSMRTRATRWLMILVVCSWFQTLFSPLTRHSSPKGLVHRTVSTLSVKELEEARTEL